MTNGRPTFKDLYDVVNERFDKLETILNGHDQRINALERFKDKAYFLWVVALGIVSVGYDYAKSRFFKK